MESLTIKILFFDTSALLKLFIDELGSDTVKWLTSNNVKVGNSLHFVVNDQVCIEFERKITDFLKYGRISVAKSHVIIDKFNRHYKNKVFRVIGQEILSNTKQEVSLNDILQKLSLVKGDDDWDGLIYQSIVNALACFDGDSHPILITCDSKFGKKVVSAGFRVIDPSKQSREQVLATLKSPDSSVSE